VQRLTGLLKESQAMAQVGGWEIDLASDTLYWTDETYRIHDTSPASYRPTVPSAISFYAPESIPVIRAAVEQSLRANLGFDLELELITAKGRRIWVRVNGRPILEQAKVVRLVGAFQDITERKRAENALKESEYFFKEAQRAAGVGSYKTDFRQGRWESSAVLDSIFGIGPDYRRDVAGWLGLVHPDDREMMDRYLREQVIGNREPFSKDYRIVRHGDGQTRWVNGFGEVQVDGDDHVLALFGTIKDITERKEAEEALRMNEAQFRGYIEHSPMGVFIADETGRYLRVNQAASRITGYTQEELLTMSIPDLLPPSSQALAADYLRQCAETGHIFGEFEYRRKDGTLGFWSVEAVRLSATQFLGFTADISKRKAAEAMVLRMTEELEQRVRERTAQLEATNKELEAFCYSVSHDLRGPLRGIDGFSGALLSDYRDRLDGTGQHYLSRIRLGAQRMGQLIDDLLKLSRINRSELEVGRVDLSGLCRKVLLELAQANPERRVQVSVEPDLVVRADRRLLLVVLENLLGNAWKFTARREDARIEVGEADGAPAARSFFIRDNGAGFEMAYVEKLFQAFQRLHASSDYEGTGIGLAIVQRIIHRHGGEVWAQGAPGEGASFFFSLPDR
jgi:PAS domain S-box-containing protein